MNVLSLFDGMSCGQIALNRAGIKYDNYYASEIDKFAIQVTQKNYPNTIQMGSVTEILGKNLPKIDLLIGGSPCQGFSFSGKLLNFDDPRSKLFFEYARILDEVKPKYFLLENVLMKKESEDIISSILEVKPIKINSNLVSAQNRVRLYWTNIPVEGFPKDKNIKLCNILENLPFSNTPHVPVYNSNKSILYTKEKFKTLVASGGDKERGIGICDDNGFWRKLTTNECEKLQTVPLDYTKGVSNTQRYKMLGNGWTVDVVAHILSFIK